MEPRPTPEVEQLFTQYERYVQAGDYRRLARLYASNVVAAGPSGMAMRSNNIVTRWFFHKGMKSFYDKAGMTSMRVVRLSEDIISDVYSMVHVTWTAQFRKTADQQLEFHISYLVMKLSRKNPRISMFIAHEDETKILEGYGILR